MPNRRRRGPEPGCHRVRIHERAGIERDVTLVSLLTTAALFAAVALLWLAAIRVASLTSPRGLGRALSAVTLVAAAAVLQALVLGLAGLGTSPPALLVASIAIWLAARAVAPRRPIRGPAGSCVAWWRDLSTPGDSRPAPPPGSPGHGRSSGYWCRRWTSTRPSTT